jgi:soluble lytic murein transglycosylase
MRIQRFLAAMVLCTVLLVLLHTALTYTERERYPKRYEGEVMHFSELYGVPAPIVFAVIKVESNFDPHAVSTAGAKGLMQLTDVTFEWIRSKIGTDSDHVFDPTTNIRYGVYYLSYLYHRFEDWRIAFAAYNAGPARVEAWLDDPSCSKDGVVTNIPYKETANYVKKVAFLKKIYEKI